MMKTSGRITSFCVALPLYLISVSAVQKLDSISDLKKINYGQSVPKHSLILLHWFANTIIINDNGDMRLTFELDRQDYGSHFYGNFEELLNPLPPGYQYYTLGNLYQQTSVEFPNYVVNPPREYMGENRDRIIIRVRRWNTRQSVLQSIDEVYITQHYETSNQQGTDYDPAHTYQITTNLLRQLRQFSVGQNQLSLSHLSSRFGSTADNQLMHIRNKWGILACLGLLLYIVIEEKHSNIKRNNWSDVISAILILLLIVLFLCISSGNRKW